MKCGGWGNLDSHPSLAHLKARRVVRVVYEADVGDRDIGGGLVNWLVYENVMTDANIK